MSELGLSSCLSFHSRVDRARTFAQLVGAVADALPGSRPAGPGWAGWVHGGSSVRIRHRLLDRLTDPLSWGVLANAKALGEGVDLPALDAVAIVDPKQSETDVLQATGRALRRPTDTKIGTVLLPVLLTGGADPDDPLCGVDQRSLELVSGVLRALRAHDTELGSRLDTTRRLFAKARTARPELSMWLRRRAAHSLLRSRVELWLPGGATGDLAAGLALRMVREATPNWEEAYGRLLAWIDDHGTARVPQGTKVPDAGGTFSLGAWVTVQRGLRRRGLLPPERAAMLDGVPGWTWDPRGAQWWAQLDALADYLATHDDYPRQGEQWRGRKVGQFVNECRTGFKDGWLRGFPDRVAALEAMPGWVWNVRHAEWDRHFTALADWAAAHGHACPSHGELIDGFDIGRWTTKQRAKARRGDLDDERVERLRALPGWVDHTREALWEEGFARVAAWQQQRGELPPQSAACDDGYQLGAWVATQRERWRTGKLDPGRARRLEALPLWDWTPRCDPWSSAFDRLAAYGAEHGSVHRLPAGPVAGFELGAWATTQRREHATGRLAADRVAALESVPGWVWSVPDARFEAGAAAVAAHLAREGHCDPPAAHRENGVGLRAWIAAVRRRYDAGELPAERVARLEAIDGWMWAPAPTRTEEWDAAWSEALGRLRRWAGANGRAAPPNDVVLDDGFRLGGWVNKQRSAYRAGRLSPERTRRLEALPGWVWKARHRRCEDCGRRHATVADALNCDDELGVVLTATP